MAAAKYIEITTGGQLQEASAVETGGVGNAEKIVALDATGRLATNMMPVGVGVELKTLPVSEAIAAGDVINIWSDSGTVKARKADASAANAGKRAVGFALSAQGTIGQNVDVYLEGTITGLSSLTKGAVYFLSGSAAGGVTATAPTTSGYCVQEIGVALSDTEISFEPQQPIIRA